jgi:hypothetical protein
MSSAERNSVIRLVINISAAFSAFERWSVGLGVEHQLSALRRAVGLPDFKVGGAEGGPLGRAFGACGFGFAAILGAVNTCTAVHPK